MMFQGNRHRTQLHNDPLPDGPLTTRQRSMVDAVRYCASLSDFASKPKRVDTSIPVCTIPHTASREMADQIIRDGLAKAEKRIAELRISYEMYGADIFMPQAQPVLAPRLDQPSRHAVLMEVLSYVSRLGHILVRAGDSPVTLDDSNSYVVGNSPTSSQEIAQMAGQEVEP